MKIISQDARLVIPKGIKRISFLTQKSPPFWSAALCTALAILLNSPILHAGTVSGRGTLEPMSQSFGMEKPYATHVYEAQLRDIFSPVFESNCLVNFVVIPSFSSEIAMAIRKSGDHYEILSLEPKKHIWDAGYEDYIKDRKFPGCSEIPLIRKQRPLNQEIAKRIVSVWQRMIQAAHPPKSLVNAGGSVSVTVDGEEYYFGYRTSSGRWRSAKMDSPDSQTPGSKLYILSMWMLTYAEGNCPEYFIDMALRNFEPIPASVPSYFTTKRSPPIKSKP